MAELPISLGTGFDPSVEYAFRQDTQNRLGNLFAPQVAPSTPMPSMPKVDYTTNELLTQKYKKNDDFNINDAYFSDDFSKRELAEAAINRGIARDSEFMSGVNRPTITILPEGADKFLDKQFGYDPNLSIAENEDIYYRNEYLENGFLTRRAKDVGKFVGRTVGAAVLKLGQGVGYAGAMINPAHWDEQFMTHVADNSFSRYLEKAETAWKNTDTLDVYHSLDYDQKGLFSKMIDPTWWTDSVSDGVSFLLSAAVPGIGFGSLNVGGRIAGTAGRIARLATGADNIGGIGAWAFNTASESAFEAAGKFKQYKQSLIDDRNNGLNTLTDAEIESQSGHLAANVFKSNLAVLALPNAFENSMMFQKLSKKAMALKASRNIEIDAALKASVPGVPTTKIGKLFSADARLPFYGNKAVASLLMEGVWEENAQLAIERINDGRNELGFTSQYFKQLKDAVTGDDHEAAESIALGGIIGTFGTGVASKFRRNADGKFRSERRELLGKNQELVGLADKITEARNGWISLSNVYDLDKNGKVVFENGEPKVDPVKLQTKLSGMQAIASTMEMIDNVKNPDLKDFLSKDLFKDYVRSNIEANTFDQMIKRIQDVSNRPKEEIEAFGFDSEGVLTTPEQLEKYAHDIKDIYDSTTEALLEPNKTEINPDLNKVREEVFSRQAQNVILSDYYNRVYNRALVNQAKVRNPETASLSDIFADEYNKLTFKEKALEQQKENSAGKAFHTERLADIRRRKQDLIDQDPSTLENLKKTSDGFYINDRQLYSPAIHDYYDNLRKAGEIENVIEENNEVTKRLLDPERRKEAVDKIVNSQLANIPATAAKPTTPPPPGQVTPVETPRVAVTPDEVAQYKENGTLPDDVVPYIAEKVENNQPLTPEETTIREGNREKIDEVVAERVVMNPPLPPIDQVPPGGPVQSRVEYKGNVAYLTPLKSVTQEAIIRGAEEIADVSEYQEWVQSFTTSRLSDFIANGYRMFLMPDRVEWANKKTGPNYDGTLGVVAVLTNPAGDVVYFNKDYTESPNGNPITYSVDIGYTDRGDFNEKISTAVQKGMLINGKLERPTDKKAARDIYIQINNEVKNRREQLLRGEIPPQELGQIDVKASNQVPTGRYRSANEVFGENPIISFKDNLTLMEVEGQKFPVYGIDIDSDLELSNNLANLYEHTYTNKQDAEQALEYMQDIIPASSQGFNTFQVVDNDGQYTLQVKHAGNIATTQRFRDIVRGNLSAKKKIKLKIVKGNLSKPFTIAKVKDGKFKTEKVDYYNFIKDKFVTNLKGTRTTRDTVTYRPLNAYFTFEFMDNIGKPVPSKFSIRRNEAIAPPAQPAATPAAVAPPAPTAQATPPPAPQAPAATPQIEGEPVNNNKGYWFTKINKDGSRSEVTDRQQTTVTRLIKQAIKAGQNEDQVIATLEKEGYTTGNPQQLEVLRADLKEQVLNEAFKKTPDEAPAEPKVSEPAAPSAYKTFDTGKKPAKEEAPKAMPPIPTTPKPSVVNPRIVEIENRRNAELSQLTAEQDLTNPNTSAIKAVNDKYDAEISAIRNPVLSAYAYLSPSEIRQQNVKQVAAGTYWTISEKGAKEIADEMGAGYKVIPQVRLVNQSNGKDPIKSKGFTVVPNDQEAPRESNLKKEKKKASTKPKENAQISSVNDDATDIVNPQADRPLDITKETPASETPVITKSATSLKKPNELGKDEQYDVALPKDIYVTFYAEPEVISAIKENYDLKRAVYKIGWANQKSWVADRRGRTIAQIIDEGKGIEVKKSMDLDPSAKKEQIADVINSLKISMKVLFNTDVTVITDTEEIDKIKNNPEIFTPFANGSTTPGFYYQGKIYIDPRELSLLAPIHEFSHLWNDLVKQTNRPLYDKGLELVKGTEYEARIRKSYPELTDEEDILEEALATAIGDKGVLMVQESRNPFVEWLSDIWKYIMEGLGINLTPETMQNLTLEEYTDIVAASLLYGEDIAIQNSLNEDDFYEVVSPVRAALMAEAETLIPQVQGVYRLVMEGDIEQGLSDIAFQANHSESERQGAILTFGDRLVEIAVILNPNIGPTSSEDIKFLKVESQDNADDVDEEATPKKQKRRRTSQIDGISEIIEKGSILTEVRDNIDKMATAYKKIVADSDQPQIKANKSRILKVLENIENNKSAIRALVDTIHTSHSLLNNIHTKMAEVLKQDDSRAKLMTAYSLYKTGQSFSDVVGLISQVNSQLSQYEGYKEYTKEYSSIVNLLNNTTGTFNAIKDGYIQAMRPYMAETYAQTANLYGTIEDKKKKLTDERDALAAKLKAEPLRNQARHPLNIKIEKVQAQIDRLPTKERFISELLAKTEDISFIGLQALSRADSSSQLVSTSQMMADKIEFGNNQNSLVMANEVNTQLNKLREGLKMNKTGALLPDGTWDIEKLYKPIVRQTTITTGYKDDGTPISHQRDILLNKATPKFFSDMQALDAKVRDIQERLGKVEDVDKGKLFRQLDDAELARDKFIEDHTDTKLPPEHFEIQRLLKEDLGNGRSVDRETYNVFQRIKSVASNIQDSGFEDAIKNDAYESAALNVRMEEFLNGKYAPVDSIEYKIAERLDKAIKLRDQIGDFELTDDARSAFEKKLQWDIRNFTENEDSVDKFYTGIQYYTDLNSVDLNAGIRKTLSSIDEQQTDFNFSDNFAARQSILEDATDTNGVLVGQRVQNIPELRRLEAEYKAAVDKLSPPLRAMINNLNATNVTQETIYYKRELNRQIRALAETLTSDTVTHEKAQELAEKEIENTDWYKNNHTNNLPNSEWTMSFPYPADGLAQLEAGVNYKSYKLHSEYLQTGTTQNNGRPYVKDGDTEYTDKDYVDMQSNNKPYAEFLEWYTQTYFEGQKNYKEPSRLSYLLPSMRKTGGEMLANFFVKGPANAIRTAISDISLNEQEEEANYGSRNLEQIPVRLSSTIDTKDQSKDIVGSLLMYNHFANRYKAIQQIEPMLVGARDMLKGLNTNSTAQGKKGFWAGITGMYNYATGKAAPQGPTVIQEGTTMSNTATAMNILAKEVLYGNFDNEFVIPMFGGTDANELVKNVMSAASKGTFFGSVISPLKNMLGASVQQAIFANRKAGAFTYADWGRAKLDFSSNFGDFNKDFLKFGNKSLYGQVFERLKLLQGDITNEFGKRTQWNAAKFGTNWLLQFKNHAEFEIQATQAFAMLNNQQVDFNGNKIPLKDAWELDQDGNVKLKDGVNFSPDQEFAFSQRAQQFQRAINGAYRQSERTASERTALGKLLFYMNRYFVPMFNARFRPSYYNPQAGEDIQGFHLTSFKFMRDTLVSYRGDIIKSWADLNEAERIDVIRTTKEIGAIISLALLTSLLGRGDNDRRKRNTNVENYSLGLLIGVYAEARSFVFPSDYYNKISSPFFAFRPLSTVISLFDNLGSYAPSLWGKDDDPNFTEDRGFWDKGDSKALADALRLIGFTGGSASLFTNPTGKDKDSQEFAKNVESALRQRN